MYDGVRYGEVVWSTGMLCSLALVSRTVCWPSGVSIWLSSLALICCARDGSCRAVVRGRCRVRRQASWCLVSRLFFTVRCVLVVLGGLEAESGGSLSLPVPGGWSVLWFFRWPWENERSETYSLLIEQYIRDAAEGLPMSHTDSTKTRCTISSEVLLRSRCLAISWSSTSRNTPWRRSAQE